MRSVEAQSARRGPLLPTPPECQWAAPAVAGAVVPPARAVFVLQPGTLRPQITARNLLVLVYRPPFIPVGPIQRTADRSPAGWASKINVWLNWRYFVERIAAAQLHPIPMGGRASTSVAHVLASSDPSPPAMEALRKTHGPVWCASGPENTAIVLWRDWLENDGQSVATRARRSPLGTHTPRISLVRRIVRDSDRASLSTATRHPVHRCRPVTTARPVSVSDTAHVRRRSMKTLFCPQQPPFLFSSGQPKRRDRAWDHPPPMVPQTNAAAPAVFSVDRRVSTGTPAGKCVVVPQRGAIPASATQQFGRVVLPFPHTPTSRRPRSLGPSRRLRHQRPPPPPLLSAPHVHRPHRIHPS